MSTANTYHHGGSPRSDLIRFHLSGRSILDFSVNINFLGPPEEISRRWDEALSIIVDYPPVEGDGLSSFYQTRCGIPPENVLTGNGSTEMIYLCARVFGFKKVLVMTPSYHDYERASILAGGKVTHFPLSPEEEFSFPSADRLIQAMKRTEALWMGRPNNPTGTMVSKALVLEIAEQCPDQWILLDEAFIQFLDDWERESLLMEPPRPNILVIHSLTKFYALAGLRLGGIMGPHNVISRMRKAKEPWTVNAIANWVGAILRNGSDYEAKTQIAHSQERERVYGRLKKMEGIMAFPASANFFLCQWTRTEDLDDLLRYLLTHGAYVRDCRNFPGLEKNYFRVGLRSPEENNCLLNLLETANRNAFSA